MKLTIDRSTLQAAFNTVRTAAARNAGHLVVLTGVRIDAHDDGLELTCSDLDQTISQQVSVIADSAGVCIAPVGLLGKILAATRTTAVTLEYDTEDDLLTVTGGRSTHRLRCYPVHEWPKISPVTDGDTCKLPASLMPLLAEVTAYASTDTTRPILTGVHFADGVVEATDSFKAMRAKIDYHGPDVNVPVETIAAIAAHGADVDLQADGRQATFTVGDTTITTRLIEGNFPNIAGVMRTKHDAELVIDADEWREALNIVAPFAADEIPVRIAVTDDGLHVSAVDETGGSETTIDCTGGLAGYTIGMTPKHVKAASAPLAGEIRIGVVDALKPLVIGDDTVCRILMPRKIA